MVTSQKEVISVFLEGNETYSCSAAIMVPDIVLSEAGHIRTFSTQAGPQAKHEFYAIAQTAFIQFQDNDLAVMTVETPIVVEHREDRAVVTSGLALVRRHSGEIIVVANSPQSHRKLLEAAHRFCTRWIRLDI